MKGGAAEGGGLLVERAERKGLGEEIGRRNGQPIVEEAPERRVKIGREKAAWRRVAESG